jgi:large subunit ribosomal protein L6
MSRIGSSPIQLPSGVEVKIDGSTVTVSGPKGELMKGFDPSITIVLEDRVLRVQRASDEDRQRALHGLTRSLLANMVTGVSEGFQRSLDLIGTGYRAQQREDSLVLAVGYSHTVEVQPMPGITLETEGQSRVRVSGIDKEIVGEQAARIRAIRKPNVYTGKGIRYVGEQVRLKPGKRAAATA